MGAGVYAVELLQNCFHRDRVLPVCPEPWSEAPIAFFCNIQAVLLGVINFPANEAKIGKVLVSEENSVAYAFNDGSGPSEEWFADIKEDSDAYTSTKSRSDCARFNFDNFSQ